LSLAFVSCGNEQKEEAKNADTTAAAEPAAPAAEPVTVSLFDGQSLSDGMLFNKLGEVKNWKVENGALVCWGSKRRSWR
jgi:hypothetical protein